MDIQFDYSNLEGFEETPKAILPDAAKAPEPPVSVPEETAPKKAKTPKEDVEPDIVDVEEPTEATADTEVDDTSETSDEPVESEG